MLSSSRACALLLSLVSSAAASRLQSYELGESRAKLCEDCVDLTQYLETPEVKSKMAVKGQGPGNKCCCDVYGDAASHKINSFFNSMFNGTARTGRCMIFPNTEFCKNVPKPDWAETTPLVGPQHTDQPCQVHKDKVKEVYELLGSPPAYCKADPGSPALTLTPPSIKLKGSVTVSCGAGFTPKHDSAVCVYGTDLAGRLEPKPECVAEENWCLPPEHEEESYDGHPKVKAAGSGQSVQVSCADEGWEPVVTEVTCQQDHSFSPAPTCKPIENYCKAESFENLEGKPAVYEDSQLGASHWFYCNEPGYDANGQWTVCAAGGIWDPAPVCSKILEYCPAPPQMRNLPGMPFISAGLVNEPMTVTCFSPGYENGPKADAVMCGKDGKPSFDESQPLCRKVRDYCQGVKGEGEGNPWVGATELGEQAMVVCDDGHHPERALLTCMANEDFGDNGHYDGVPSCVSN